MNLFERANETLSTERLRQFQLERLQALVARVTRNVRPYRERLGETKPGDLAGLAHVPPTTIQDLIEAFPYGFFALPLREVIRLHSMVGPGGKSLVIGHTRNDLTNWGRLVARQLVAAGITANDVIQIGFGTGVFNQALGYMLGAEMIEASVIPQDAFHIEQQLDMMQNYRSTVLITTPTNAADLADLIESSRLPAQSLHLRVVLLTRPVSQDERMKLADHLSAEVRYTFGIPEILDPGIALECGCGSLHVNEDHFLVEVDGGELLVTTLCRESMPLIRFRTRIQAELDPATRCPCGRTGVILRPGDRMDAQLRVNEVPVYQEQIAEVLSHTGAAGQAFEVQIAERRIVIGIEVTLAIFSDTMRDLDELRASIISEMFARLGIEAEVRFLNRKSQGALER